MPLKLNHYQWLQIWVNLLLVPEDQSPLTKEEKAVLLKIIKNFAALEKIELDDPNFLQQVAQRLHQINSGQKASQLEGNIPFNLDELKAQYDERLAEIRDRSRQQAIRASLPTLDEEIEALQIRYAREIRQGLSELEKENPLEVIIVSERAAAKITAQLVETSPEKIPETAPQEQKELTKKVLSEELGRLGLTPPSEEKVEQITRAVWPVARKQETERKLTQIGGAPVKAYLAPSATDEEAKELGREVKNIVRNVLPFEFRADQHKDVLQKVKPAILEKCQRMRLPFPSETQLEKFIEEYAAVSLAHSSVLAEYSPSISQDAEAYLAARTDVPAYWFQLPLWRSYLSRIVFGAQTKAIEAEIKKASATLEEKEILLAMAQRGVFSQDYQATREGLPQADSRENQTFNQQLRDQEQRFLEVEAKYPQAISYFKRYWQLTKKAGRWQGYFDPKLGRQISHSATAALDNQLRQSLDQLNSALGLAKKIRLPSGKTITQPLSERVVLLITRRRYTSLSHLRGSLYRKTLGRAFTALAKREGFKKAVAFLGSKVVARVAPQLAIELGLIAAGTAAAPISFGLSLVIAGAIDIVIRVGTWVWDKIKDSVRGLINKPEKSLLIIGGAIVIFLLAPGAAKALGAIPFVVGAAGLAGWASGSLGLTATGWVNTVGAVITAFLAGPTIAPVGLLVAILLGGIALMTFFVILVVSGAFVIPIQPTQPLYEQEHFSVNKTVSPQEIADLDELNNYPKLTYTVNVSADQPILISSIQDNRSVSCQGAPPTLTEPSVNLAGYPEEATDNWTSESYEMEVNPSFADCRVCNTVTVVASIPGKNLSGVQVSDTKCVKIGDPPEDCPETWPTSRGFLTQGPNTSLVTQNVCTSHYRKEAIDIRTYPVIGAQVLATHRGQATSGGSPEVNGGNFVKITGNCNGQPFTSYYYHLDTASPPADGKVTVGTPIGTSGNTGPDSTGAHLHYQLVGLPMRGPFIPCDIPQGCYNTSPVCNQEPCGISWSSVSSCN